MKTKQSLLRLILCAVCAFALCAAIAAFAGCGLGKSETYELVSAETVENENNDDYTYLKSEKEQNATYGGRLCYDFKLKLKSSSGKEYEDVITIYVEDGDRDVYFQLDGLPSVPLGVEIGEVDDAAPGSGKELTFKFNGNNEFVTDGVCEVNVKYDVVHYVKKIALEGSTTLEEEYERGEQFDPSVIKVVLTYGDGTTETVGLDEASAIKQLKGTGVEGFDSSTSGYGKRMTLTLKTANGKSTQSLIYKVKPASEWTQEKAVGYGYSTFYYYKTAEMTAAAKTVKGVNTLEISFGNVKLYAVQGSGYLLNPTASLIQSEMNKELTGNQVNLFNMFVPGGNKAQVTNFTRLTDSSLKVAYNLNDAEGNTLSQNVMYDVYSVTGKQQIMITVENIDGATDEEKQLVEEFVNYIWFSK